ncbi:MAG: hypothetical protein A2Z34_09085 [Planctomycetes bacterium RBG_16_59_8]|nr:MAG: hypothetical protein A2Z34_09085 [Planctomycetes bacterium RBG_16_59_8]
MPYYFTMKRNATIVLLLLAGFAARGYADEPPRTGTFEEKEETTGVDIAYYIPEAYDKDKTYSIFVAHHGVGDGGVKMRAHMLKFLKEKDWILICPTNAGLVRGNAGQTVKDADKVADASKSAVEKILKNYHTDKKRVLVMGYSGGGHTLARSFEKYPETFAAMAVCSCNGPTFAFTANGNDRPVFIVRGEKDLANIVRDAGKYKDGLTRAGYKSVKSVVIPDGKHYVGEETMRELFAWWDEAVLKHDAKK